MTGPKTPAGPRGSLVTFRGGDLDGRWFTRADWDEWLQAETRMLERGQRPGPASRYTPTSEQEIHPDPHQHEAIGVVWVHDPDSHVIDHLTNHDQNQHLDYDQGQGREEVEAQEARPAEREQLQPMRVLVTGSRTWSDAERIVQALNEVRAQLEPGRDLILVHGAAQGADAIADAWAQGRRAGGDEHVVIEAHPADWRQHGAAAGPRRNAAMVAAGADLCLSFNHNDSAGTRGCTRLARVAGITTTPHNVTDVTDTEIAADASTHSPAGSTTGPTVAHPPRPARATRSRGRRRPVREDVDSMDEVLW